MLLSLEVRDFVIVEQVALEFSSGLTVLTGETGAGKSILVDALGLVLGARAESGCVRQGAERADITALFALPAGIVHADAGANVSASADADADPDPDPAADADADADASQVGALAWLLREGFPVEEPEVLIRRTIDVNGRSRSWINGRSATLQQLRDLGCGLLDIHGQHAHQSLLRPRAQGELLDAFAGATAQAGAVAQAWRAWQSVERALSAFAERAAARQAEQEALTREEQELAAVALTPEAWAELQQEQARLAHAHSLLSAAQQSVDSLTDGEADVLSSLHAIIQRLTALESIDPVLAGPRELVDNAAIGLSEAVHALRKYAHGVEADPERLVAVEDQMQRLLATARRYRLLPEAMHARLQAVRTQLALLQEGSSEEALGQQRDLAQARYRKLAKELSQLRQKAAERLGQTVTASIRALAMGDGVFTVGLRPVAGGSADGDEQVEFGLAAYPGQPAGALARIASGGELSRVSLALQTALSEVARVPTLVFDEVDTGIGGRVAEIVGRLLHAVGARCQVMCVTHLPQVAAWADHHLQVSKAREEGAPVSRIDVLEPSAREAEIARMLGGIEITDTTRQHARELLAARPAR